MNKIWQDEAWEYCLYLQKQDKKILKRINQILKDIARMVIKVSENQNHFLEICLVFGADELITKIELFIEFIIIKLK